MAHSAHRTVYRNDYTPYPFDLEQTHLRFELGEEITRVIARLAFRKRNSGTSEPLVLNGHRFVLCSLSLDGRTLSTDEYHVDDESLTIPNVPAVFNLECITEMRPQDNTFLEGLYRSAGMFCTQCEAEGFRSITYYPDHPDVLSVFTTTIVADKRLYPVLLSNGNLTERGDVEKGRHFATWYDPFRKPSYLFALVAGDLVCVEDGFTTCSGRHVALQLYLQEANRHKGAHALRSLQKAMRWDEEIYGREYDLDSYMIVAVDDFNMGAMENKGLNIFNSRYVLATPDSATDEDFQAIEEVIGHEYFHNWSGNRITCRDWFQLSLKEGLTVFRDQEFSADMQSRGVKRIADVRYLRTMQFPEDAGPLAHPVRPDSYIDINNFYTHTVYNKGAEIIRMLWTLLGPERFRQGMDLYFTRHDGQAVTVDDFIQAFSDAAGIDLVQFKRWYSQAGTPVLSVTSSFEAEEKIFTLEVRQSCPATPGQSEKLPFHLPLVIGLLDRQGVPQPIALAGEKGQGPTSRLIELRDEVHTFRFSGLNSEPVPVLLRGFSAPVKLEYPYSQADLVLLAAHESDPFCRWEAGQRLACDVILGLAADVQAGQPLKLADDFIEAYRLTLASNTHDRAFLAEALTLPSERYLAEMMTVADPDAIHAARQFVIRTLALRLRQELLAVRESCRKAVPYAVDDGRAGERRLANLCLSYLMSQADQPIIDLCRAQYLNSDNMTDTMGALSPLASCDCPERHETLESFYDCWQHDRNVVDKWFTVQALSSLPGTRDGVVRLLAHPAFELGNPNRFRSLVAAFSQNQVRFHSLDGSGYRLVTDQIIRLIPLNPQVSARLLAPLTTWRRYDSTRQQLMRKELERVMALENLPRDVFEVVNKGLRGS